MRNIGAPQRSGKAECVRRRPSDPRRREVQSTDGGHDALTDGSRGAGTLLSLSTTVQGVWTMRTRNKVAVGFVAASVAVIGLVLLAAAQSGAGMVGRNAGRMMGGASAGATGTCPMGKAQCSPSGASPSGAGAACASAAGATGNAASCPMVSSGAAGSAGASCPAAKTGGTCKMGAGSGPTTCPMSQGRSGA
jgi:hypothetical protein